MLRHFYALGAFWGDSGTIAYLLWHSGALLEMPRVDGGGSFFATHFTPIFIPIAALSRLLPLTKIQFFAAFSGVSFMLPSIAVFWLLRTGFAMRGAGLTLGAALLSMLFAFNGITLAVARNPHFEMLVVGTGMLFLVAFIQRRFALAALFFVLCLTTREDAGLDLFALLAVATAMRWSMGEPLRAQGPAVVFGLAALLYSVAALVVQHVWFPGGDAFVRVYLGRPAFAGVSWGEIANRLAFYAAYRLYVFLPFCIALAWSLRVRNPTIIAGYVAFIPWLLLQLFASSPIANTLSNYYAFPFVFALFWPLIGLQMAPASNSQRPLLVYALVLLSAFADVPLQHNPGHIDLPGSFLHPPSLLVQRATDAGLQRLAASRASLGRVAVDGSIAALDPDDYAGGDLLTAPNMPPPDTVIFFAQGYQAPLARNIAAQAGLHLLYAVPNSEIRIATRRAITAIPGLVPAA